MGAAVETATAEAGDTGFRLRLGIALRPLVQDLTRLRRTQTS